MSSTVSPDPSLTLQKKNSIEAWGRRMSHRTSVAAAIVAEEVKQNNCCCCHIIERHQKHKDQLCLCLFSSVDSMEFYPLAVTLYFLILISIITFIACTLYYTNNIGMQQMQKYCILDTQFGNVKHLFLYAHSPMKNMYITIDYVLVILLILWESLLNWYRFYSTKFMSLNFNKPPYTKIFGFFLIYAISFLCLCIVQMYIIFLLFPVIIIIHVVFNSYCVYGFIIVLNNQYKHYVQSSIGVSEIIINDLKATMRKLKICAICCIISSTLFLLTFTLCHYGDIVVLSAPLWWITNCICWMLTFAKNTLWFKHQCTNVMKKCRQKKCCYYFGREKQKTNINRKRTKSKEMAQKKIEMVEKFQTEIRAKEIQPLSTLLEVDTAAEANNFPETLKTPTKSPLTPLTPGSDGEMSPTTPIASNADTNSDNIVKDDTECNENVVSGIKLPTIADDKEFKDSPMSTSIIRLVGRNSMLKNSKDTPMSIVITPAGQTPQNCTQLNRASSVTYQYPTDYEDDMQSAQNENENDYYFTFPNQQNLNQQNEQSMSKKIKQKALDILGVVEYEDTSKTKTKISKNIKMEALHVPNKSTDSMDQEVDEKKENNNINNNIERSQSERKSKQNKIYYPNNVHMNETPQTVTDEPSHNIWDLFVNNGLMSSQTIKSLHQLEEYTSAAHEQIENEFVGVVSLPRQRSSHL